MKQIFVLDENGTSPENMIIATMTDGKIEVILNGEPLDLLAMTDKINETILDKTFKILREKMEQLLN